MNTHGVTQVNPPKNELFSDFYTVKTTPATPATPATPTPNSFNPTAYPFGFPMPAWPSAFPPMFAPTTPTVPSNRTHDDAMPSSDPPEIDAPNPYPLISEFLTLLSANAPKRLLTELAPCFEEKDFEHIDEIADLSASVLMTEFGLSLGNAQFLLTHAKKEITRIDKATRKAKRARLE